jgi:hypothetical protein
VVNTYLDMFLISSNPTTCQHEEWYLLGCYAVWLFTRATRRNNPEDTILHSHRRENLKSYITSQHIAASMTLYVMRLELLITINGLAKRQNS